MDSHILSLNKHKYVIALHLMSGLLPEYAWESVGNIHVKGKVGVGAMPGVSSVWVLLPKRAFPHHFPLVLLAHQ